MDPNQRDKLRTIMKGQLAEYLTLDNQITQQNKALTSLKKKRTECENVISEIGEVLNLSQEQLRYHNETIHFNYTSQKPGLSNGLIKSSLDQYFNQTDSWRRLPPAQLIDTILETINNYKETEANNKKKNLKIKRVRHKET